jgi:hypothetical protein
MLELIVATVTTVFVCYEYAKARITKKKEKEAREKEEFTTAVSMLNLDLNRKVAELSLLYAEAAVKDGGLNGKLDKAKKELQGYLKAQEILEKAQKGD